MTMRSERMLGLPTEEWKDPPAAGRQNTKHIVPISLPTAELSCDSDVLPTISWPTTPDHITIRSIPFPAPAGKTPPLQLELRQAV